MHPASRPRLPAVLAALTPCPKPASVALHTCNLHDGVHEDRTRGRRSPAGGIGQHELDPPFSGAAEDERVGAKPMEPSPNDALQSAGATYVYR
jgi:hypothetical protein